MHGYARPVGTFSQTDPHIVWRFYKEAELGWKWQCLSVGGTVISQSDAGFDSLAECLAEAEGSGYVFKPSETRKRHQ
jgi:hypothetical protein